MHDHNSVPPINDSPPVAVLMSGGSDSAILAADLARQVRLVHPIYIRFGLRWEDVELQYAKQFLAELGSSMIRPLVVLDQPMEDVYGDHWSRTGQVPDADSQDEAVYLPGRNILLMSKASVWCALNGVHAIYSGVLSGNPFPDASSGFFESLAKTLSEGLNWPIQIVRPYSGLSKTDVLELGRNLPLEHTFSCLNPVEGHHCGTCNKCAERHKGFRDMGINDKTVYSRPFWNITA
jgi:7-cyano-7-deazaguanine synthase